MQEEEFNDFCYWKSVIEDVELPPEGDASIEGEAQPQSARRREQRNNATKMRESAVSSDLTSDD